MHWFTVGEPEGLQGEAMTAVGILITEDFDSMPVPAEQVRQLCLGDEEQTFARRRIVGRLDLAGAHLRTAVRFVECAFDDAVDLRDARVDEALELVRCRLQTVRADRLESKGHVELTDVVCRSVSFRQAHIEGDLRLTNSSLRSPGGTAFDGSDLRVDGSVFFDGDGLSTRPEPAVRAEGEVRLTSAEIKGSVDCRWSTFDNPSGRSIDGFEMSVGVELLLEEGFVANGEVYLERVTVDRLRAGGGTFGKGGGRWALHADSLRAKTGVFLNKGFGATGEVRLVGADVTGELCCTGGSFANPGGIAFDATRLRAEDVFLDRGFTARGVVAVVGAHLTRQLNCTSGSFESRNGPALDADGLQCEGEVFLDRGFSATGEVRLMGAQIRNELNCTGGRFENPAGTALNADGLTTPGNVFLDSVTEFEFSARGEVRLARVTAGRQLKLSGAVLSNPGERAVDLSGLVGHGDVLLDRCHCTGAVWMREAAIDRDLSFDGAHLREGLDAVGVTVGGTVTWQVADTPQGDVDFSFASVGTFADTLVNWPDGRVLLAGFSCRAPAEFQLTPEQWIAWLGRTKAHYADAYEQLAAAYRLRGDDEAAKKISIARQRDLRTKDRGHLGRPARLWNRLLDVSTRYGFELHRPLAVLLVMAVVGSIVFAVAYRFDQIAWVGSGQHYPRFQPVVYSVQTLIPGMDLAEISHWLPKTDNAWGMAVMGYWWLAVVVGWLASGALIAGIGRFFRQQS